MIAQPCVQRRLQLLCIVALAACAAPKALAQQRDTAGSRQPARSEKSCQCHPKLVGKCFTVHGALSLYSRAPTARISIVGTKRVLGLKEGLPEWLEEALEERDTAIFGDFLVCPFTRPKSGAMQLVCIESASNMIVRKREGPGA